ncbi:MAG: deoxynucleoside kinase [Thiotrichales bacterium]
MSELPKYIVVEGPIGVGKTTLTRRLAKDLQGAEVLEQPDNNPFLERFYSNPRDTALHTQLHFLLERQAQTAGIEGREDDETVVSDFLLEKDRLFAQATLSEDELKLYERIYDQLIDQAPVPDLVIYLQAPVDVLLQRIRHRGRRFERPIDSTYLNQLNDAYARFFHYYEEAPLLIVNATEIDFAHNQRDYEQLFEQICSTTRGRHYFNPLPSNIQAG